MQPQIFIKSADVEKLKQQARKLKRENGIKHSEALDLIAKQSGFNHWHHVSESAKKFEPTETAYYFGVIIAMDIKDGMDFRDPTGGFVMDNQASTFCANDLHQNLLEAIDEEDGTPLRDKYSEAELKEWAEENVDQLIFFRYTGASTPERIEDVISLVRKCSFWPPEYIWFKGSFQESPSNHALGDAGELVGFRF